MPRPATGTVETHAWRDGRTRSFWLRVPYRGQRYRLVLGTNHEGWNDDRAQVELERVMGQIERGTWQPPSRGNDQENSGDFPTDETVHVTASRWWQRRRDELERRTRDDYRWRLDHVLRHLAREPTATLDARRVDEFREQLRARGLGPRSVNMVLGGLAMVLDDAVEYGLLAANPARGKRRRMKVPRTRRDFLEPDMVTDLLDTAGAWERELPAHQQYGRRALLAALCLAGPRISELAAAPRGKLDLHGGRLRVGEAKTEAGIRDIELTAFLLDEIRAHLAALPERLRAPEVPLFPTRPGGRHHASNVRNRLLAETVRRANRRRGKTGQLLLPDRVTPHTLRRTFASLSFWAGRDPRFVMDQLGHADPRLTLAVYAQTMKRRLTDDERALVWRLMRFPDEPEEVGKSAGYSPTNRPLGAEGASGAGGTIAP